MAAVPGQSPRIRLVGALAVFIVALSYGIYHQLNSDMGGGDFSFAICAARAVLGDADPYTVCLSSFRGGIAATYPLTTALYAIPFLLFQPFAAPAMFALSAGLLAFGLLQKVEPWKLLLFFSAPFYHALYYVQWSPLIAALYLVPSVLALGLVKPQIALPVILMRLNRRRFLRLAAFGLFSLFVDPTWPVRWWNTSNTYQWFIPLLVFPVGPLLLLSLLSWREERARLLFLFALVPQRATYDLVPLFLIPRSPVEMVLSALVSWFNGIFNQEMNIYLWMLAIVLYPLAAKRMRAFVTRRGALAGEPRG